MRILKACEEEKIEGVAAELMQSMIEVKTGVCKNVDEARDQLFAAHAPRPQHRQLARLRAGHGRARIRFIAPATSTVFPDERYERILDRLAWLTYQRVMFGLHVHVGMPIGDMAIGAINLLVQYLPHLIAAVRQLAVLAGRRHRAGCRAESPCIGCCRTRGCRCYFSNWKEFRNYCQVHEGLPHDRVVQGHLLGHPAAARLRHDRVPHLRHSADAHGNAAPGRVDSRA